MSAPHPKRGSFPYSHNPGHWWPFISKSTNPGFQKRLSLLLVRETTCQGQAFLQILRPNHPEPRQCQLPWDTGSTASELTPRAQSLRKIQGQTQGVGTTDTSGWKTPHPVPLPERQQQPPRYDPVGLSSGQSLPGVNTHSSQHSDTKRKTNSLEVLFSATNSCWHPSTVLGTRGPGPFKQ